MTLTFCIVSDRINSKKTDIERMNKVASAFKYLGHNTRIGSRSPNAHTDPKSLKCQGKNDVFVCIFGGVDIEVLSDHTGYKQSDWFRKKQLKKASLMYIFVRQTGGVNLYTAKKVGLAHDGKGNIPNLRSISKPAQFLKNHGITWIQDTSTANIISKIRNKQFEGAGLSLAGNKGSTTTDTQENKYTVKHGYNTSEHFEGYLHIQYTVDKSKTPKDLYIDFASDSANSDKFRNPSGLRWENNSKFKNEIPLLKFIAEKEKNLQIYRNGQVTLKTPHNYYLKKVTLVRNFEHMKDDKSTEEDETKLYDAIKDDSNYKMDLYNLGLETGEIVTSENLGAGGKTLYDAINDILGKSSYTSSIIYSKYRKDDTINFGKVYDTTNIKATFNEGFDGNIIGISNVKYSPTADLINNSITLYKTLINENKEDVKYRYARKGNINDILRYGEQTHIESISDDTGYSEASQEAYDNLEKYYKPDTTFTATVVGLPPVNVNDYVATKTVNPILTNEYRVASRKINAKVNTKPVIQTEYGLGDVDNKLKVKNNLAKQRRELVKAKLDLTEPAKYVDRMTDEFVESEEKVWVE